MITRRGPEGPARRELSLRNGFSGLPANLHPKLTRKFFYVS